MRAAPYLGLFLTVLASCNRESERTLTDTEGRTVRAKCSADGQCELTQSGGPEGAGELDVRARGRLVALCPRATAQAPASAAECRALVCSADSDCPPAHGLAHGTCVNGLCIEPSRELVSDDAVLLCLAGTGLGRSAPAQVERFAMALNCGTPCKVPRTCRQP